jgi:hypothetical protein
MLGVTGPSSSRSADGKSLDERITRMGAELRELKRAQAGLTEGRAPDDEIHRRSNRHRHRVRGTAGLRTIEATGALGE